MPIVCDLQTTDHQKANVCIGVELEHTPLGFADQMQMSMGIISSRGMFMSENDFSFLCSKSSSMILYGVSKYPTNILQLQQPPMNIHWNLKHILKEHNDIL